MHDRLVPSSVQSVSSGKEESRSVGACDLDGGLSVFSRYQLPLPRCSGRAPGSPESHSVARFAIAGTAYHDLHHSLSPTFVEKLCRLSGRARFIEQIKICCGYCCCRSHS